MTPTSDLRPPTSDLRPPAAHQAISASAGSGKTYRLAHRYIRLLAEGVPPDRICALTFSRKAAGEIFDSIVEYLCKASADPKRAAETANNISRPDFDQSAFVSLLRGFLDNLHRMHISTLDSFMVGVVRTFPSELGIPSEFQVMDSDGAQAADIREDILSRIFDPHVAADNVQRQFFEAFKQATFGQEEKNLGNRLNRFIEDNREHYFLAPDAAFWGQPAGIGLQDCAWLNVDIDAEQNATELLSAVKAAGPSDAIIERFATFAERAAEVHIGAPWPETLDYLFPRLAESMDALEQGSASVKIGRTMFELPPEACTAALALVNHIIRCEVATALTHTAGLHRVLALYENQYDANLRQTGQMTFSDAQILLTEANTAAGGALISRDPTSAGKLYIDYRLDCQLDHWLLDEFQDTSDLQWAVLRNLADEILQDDTGERSFFYVGDVKQAIYAWRGGNARLFGRILDHYGERIERVPMNVSYRSCPAIIKTVNAIFSDVSEEHGLRARATEAWRRIWEHHESAGILRETAGYAALIEPAKPAGNRFGDSDRYDTVAAILNEIEPIQRGLDVAVLVMSNRAGYALVDHLRHACPEMPVVHEGNTTIVDNPVVALLLSLLQVASHPGDTFAWQHIQMSPLRKHPGVKAGPGAFALELSTLVHTHGFQAAVRHWGRMLAEQHKLDAFGHGRLEDLIEAAATFDETGSRDIDAFLRYANAHQVKEQTAARAVRVMTVHQSKGLGFDIVIFPELQGRSMTTSGALELTTATDPETEQPLWVLDMPRRAISIHTPVLADQVDCIDDDTCFNALCALYVALTRAKQALYMVTHKPGKTSKSQNAAAFVKTRLKGEPNPELGEPLTIAGHDCAVLHEEGQRDWFNAHPKKEAVEEAPPPPPLPADYNEHPSARTRLERVEPSSEKEVVSSAALLFREEMREILDFGSAIHALFEEVEWIDGLDTEAVIATWLQRSTDNEEVKRDVCKQFRDAVVMPSVREALTRPEGEVELWREMSFEIVLENQWVSGQFDRVVIIRDSDGHATSATILDYKSNRIDQPAQFEETTEHYRPQLELYGRALSHILKLPESAITKQLLFTRTGVITTV